MLMPVLGLTLWLSAGILYNIYAHGDYWEAMIMAYPPDKAKIFGAFVVCSLSFPVILAVDCYDRKHH